MSNPPELVRNWRTTYFGPDLVQQSEEQVRIVQENLKAAQSRQKSNYDRKHREMEYQPGEYAYLCVTPMRGTHRFGIIGKLAPRYIGPFCILPRSGPVAYRLEFPPNLSQVHDVFHVSQLRRCFKDPIREVEHDLIELQQDLCQNPKLGNVLELVVTLASCQIFNKNLGNQSQNQSGRKNTP